ncbi:MAG: protein-glutamine glutaminase family protein [Bacteriovoracaceae bacterium]
MKLLPFIVLIFSFSLPLHAERLTTRIHSVERSPDSKRPHIVRFENGRVGFVSSADKSVLSTLLHSKNEWLDVELDEKSNFLGAGVVPAPKGLTEESLPAQKRISYDPSNLSSMDDAEDIFQHMRKVRGDHQCYNRAHVWTYDEFKRSGLKSMKLFMFFTRAYIWKYHYKWWFHVTPMTYVNNEPITLDHTFMKHAVPVKTWTDKFIYSKRDCPMITKYSDYSQHQDTEHCYLHPASMYFWQPRDLETYENTGYEKTDFIKWEVNWAFRDAGW